VPAARPVSFLAFIGKLADGVDCPSRVIQFVNAVAMSLLVVLVVDDEIVVPVTTGLPAGRLYVPEPLKAIIFLLLLR
jgi:hypothetical protein